MAVSGAGSLVLGHLFDRFGFVVLIGLTLVSALFAPLVFLGGFWTALIGAVIWGLGTFTAGYGLFWFLGSAAIGILYDVSLLSLIAFCIMTQLAAIPIFVWVGRRRNLTIPPLRNSH
ncbi:MAG: hypothetical protein WAU53_00095 [Rhodoplanes sp.]